jgi:hypothetical protein
MQCCAGKKLHASEHYCVALFRNGVVFAVYSVARNKISVGIFKSSVVLVKNSVVPCWNSVGFQKNSVVFLKNNIGKPAKHTVFGKNEGLETVFGVGPAR